MITEFLLFLSSMIGITWSLTFLLAGIIGINIHKVSGHRMEQFRKNITHASIWNNDEPEGWVTGRWYLGYFLKNYGNRGDISYELYIICSRSFYNIYIAKTEHSEESNKPATRKKFINYYERDGNAVWNFCFVSRQIPFTEFTARSNQQKVIDVIQFDYEQRDYTVVLLWGAPGKGKSMIPHFIAKQLLNSDLQIKKVSLVDSFYPFQAGNQFSSLYNKVSPSKDSPLIIVVEEVDIGLSKIHDGTLVTHRDIPILITNKTDWNIFFDRFDRKLYPWVYFIMTTNKNASYFDELDASYMRDGRVNLKCQV
jgi:hypothetical protein